MITEEILTRLSGVRRNGTGWMAKCPAHEDRQASLSITAGNDGRTLLCCHAGCEIEAVCGALKITMADLYSAPKPTTSNGRRIAATYPYHDEDGNLLFEVVRFEPKDFRQRRPDPSSKDGWDWSTSGVRRVLFGLPVLVDAIKEGRTIYVVEGEKDVLAMTRAGLIATCNPGGAGKWLDSYSEALRGANVIVIADKDEPGRQHARKVSESLAGIAKGVGIIEVPDVNGCHAKDAADFLAAGGTAQELIAIRPGKTQPKFTSLRPYLDGTIKQEVPTVAEAFDGRHFFYAGRINEVHGEPGAGKTNILVAAANVILESGGTVLYLDPEDTPQGLASRALALGGDPLALSERLFYLHNPCAQDYADAQAWAQEFKPTMTVLDGLAEALAAEGKDENSPGDILLFLRQRIRPFAEAGSAVVLADHVTKATDGRGRWARGSGAKLGRYDGAVYSLELVKPYTPIQPGFCRIRISKDRNGGAGPSGRVIAEMHLAPSIGGMTLVDFRPAAESGSFRPTAIMEKIERYLDQNGPTGKRTLRGLGKSQYVDAALSILIEEGSVTVHQEGQKTVYDKAK